MKKLFLYVFLVLMGCNVVFAENLTVICTIVALGDKEYAEGDYEYHLVFKENKMIETNLIHKEFSEGKTPENILTEGSAHITMQSELKPQDKWVWYLNRYTGYLTTTIYHDNKKFRTDKLKCKKSDKI